MLGGITIERNAFDVLQCKVRSPDLVDAGVIEPRDAWMFQRSKNVPLAIQAFCQPAVQPRDARQLQRDLPSQRAVRALGKPDGRGTAGAQLANQTIRPDEIAAADCGKRD